MEIKYLKTFQTIVKTGSLTKAAEELKYTQSAITFQIDRLEEELDVKLFEKRGRNMLMTQAAKLLIPYVNEVICSVEKLKSFENDLETFKGDLHIGVGETLLCYLMPNVLKKFNKKAPMTRLHIKSMNCYDIRDKILDGSLDLGIFYEDIGGLEANISAYSIGSYGLKLVGSKDTKERYSDFITPGRDIPVPLIINEANCIFRRIFERYLQKKSINIAYTIELWSIPTIKNLVKNNVGISYLPGFTVEKELEHGDLVEIDTEISHSYLSAVCAHHKSKWLSPAEKLFIDLCTSMYNS